MQNDIAREGAARRSVPYEDIFDSAAEAFASTSGIQSTSSTVPETPRTRSKRLRLDEDGNGGEAILAQAEAENAQLCDSLRAFGQLPTVRKAADSICEVQGKLLASQFRRPN